MTAIFMNNDVLDIESPFESNFSFWGKRNYVQGSHIIYGFLEAVDHWHIGDIEKFSISIHNVLRAQGKFRLFQSEKRTIPEFQNTCAIFQLSTKSGEYQAILQEDSRPVTGRLPDDENVLVSCLDLDISTMSGTLSSFPYNRLFTVIIALNKAIHKAVFSSNGYGQWFLARMDINRTTPLPIRSLSVRIARNIGERLTRSIIIADGSSLGEVYFSRTHI